MRVCRTVCFLAAARLQCLGLAERLGLDGLRLGGWLVLLPSFAVRCLEKRAVLWLFVRRHVHVEETQISAGPPLSVFRFSFTFQSLPLGLI